MTFYKKAYTEFHVYPTDCSVADARSQTHRQRDSRTWVLRKSFFISQRTHKNQATNTQTHK